MTENARDAGLVRAVGPLALAASFINCVVASAIFVVPAALAAAVGAYASFAILVCAAAMGAILICFAAGGRRIATSGGPYGYIQSAFGPLAGCVAGTMLWVSDLLSCGGIAAAVGDAGASLVQPAFAPITRVAIVLGMLGVVSAINIVGVAWGARFIAVATLLKLVPLAVSLVAGIVSVPQGPNVPLAAPTMQGFGRAMILGFFAFTGFEMPLIASGEVAQPKRTIPLALGMAMGLVTLLYVAVQLVAQRMLGAALATSVAPLADAMARVSPALQALLLVGSSFSMFAWLGSDLLSTPRMLFGLARDRMLPRFFGRLHPRARTPHVAIISYAVVAALLAVTGSFAELVVLSTLPACILYLGSCAAAWVLARRAQKSETVEPPSRWLRLAAIVGISSMVMLIACASWAEIGGLAVLLGVTVLAYGVRLLKLKSAPAT